MADEKFDVTKQEGYASLKTFIAEHADEYKGVDIDGVKDMASYEAIVKKIEEHKKTLEGKPGAEGDEKKQTKPENKEENKLSGTIEVEGNIDGAKHSVNAQGNLAAWKAWCDDDKRKYIFDNVSTEGNESFEIYKNETDKKNGKKHAYVQYKGNSVNIQSNAYEVWKFAVDKALKDGKSLSVRNMLGEMAGEKDKDQMKIRELEVKMVLVAAVVAGGVDKVQGDFPKGFKIEDKDLDALGLSAEEKKAYHEAASKNKNKDALEETMKAVKEDEVAEKTSPLGYNKEKIKEMRDIILQRRYEGKIPYDGTLYNERKDKFLQDAKDGKVSVDFDLAKRMKDESLSK